MRLVWEASQTAFRDGVWFVEHIGTAPSPRKVTEEDAVTIAHICRQLDGIPLALELAAPLTRSLSLAGIAAQLHDRMTILTNSYRTAIPRHHTMHSALIWSYPACICRTEASCPAIGFRRTAVGFWAGTGIF